MGSVANFTRQSCRLVPQTIKQVSCFSTSSTSNLGVVCDHPYESQVQSVSKPKKLRVKTPHWNDLSRRPYQELEQFKPWPKGVNPHTGEGGGPTGPEPTRYGDWERKGRCSDF